MRPKEKLTIRHFADRLGWIVNNLDANASLARFCNFPDDVFEALISAVNRGLFVAERHYSSGGAIGRHAPGRRTWQRALSDDEVPRVLVDWLLALFPDLTEPWLTSGSIRDFYKSGEDIQRGRARWRAAIELFAKERRRVEDIARGFYQHVDASQSSGCPIPGIRLLTKPGWMRSRPMLLREDTESPFLRQLGQGRSFLSPKLTGLRGDFISYKGSLTYQKRRKSKIEPQHNGEIFCAISVDASDEGEFVGFQYNLAHYYDYVNTCEILGAELADWIISAARDGSEHQILEYRGAPESAFDLSKRASYPGINCLSVFMGYSEAGLDLGNYFLLHKRDETQLQAQNTVHVLPAGGHQGHAKGAVYEDAAMWRTVVREFLEELFNKEELYVQSESWSSFLGDPRIRELAEIFFRGAQPAASIYVHGFGLDPVTLKPEVIVTIVVDWQKALKRRRSLTLEYNWEVKNRALSRHHWVPLSKGELVRHANGRVLSLSGAYLDTLPAGSACMLATLVNYDGILLKADPRNH